MINKQGKIILILITLIILLIFVIGILSFTLMSITSEKSENPDTNYSFDVLQTEEREEAVRQVRAIVEATLQDDKMEYDHIAVWIDPEETEAAFRSYYDGTAWFSENQDWNVSENNFIAVGVFIDSKDINIIKEPLYYIVLKNEDTWEIVSIWNN